MQGLLPAVSPCCWLANLTPKMITVCMAPHGANVCTCMNSRGKGDEKGAHCQCRSRPEKAWSSMRQMLPHSATIIKIVVCRFNAQRILLRDCCQNWLRQPPGPSPRARGIASKACMSRRTGRLFGSGRVCHACTCRRSCAMGAVGSHVCSSKGASGVKAGREMLTRQVNTFSMSRLTPANEGLQRCTAMQPREKAWKASMASSCDPAW